jgi:hypothetical protein
MTSQKLEIYTEELEKLNKESKERDSKGVVH